MKANPILSSFQLSNPPGLFHSRLTRSLFIQQRHAGCQLIQAAGRLLNLSLLAIASAQVLLARFMYLADYTRWGVLDISMAAIMLGAKLHEGTRKAKDIIAVFHYLLTASSNSGGADKNHIQLSAQLFAEWRENIFITEMHILREMGFAVSIEHGYGLLANYISSLELMPFKECCQKALNYLNDSYRSEAMLMYQPNEVAATCIMIAARDEGVWMPDNWHLVFEVEEEALQVIEGMIKDVYNVKFLLKDQPLTDIEMQEFLEKNKSNS